MKESDISAVWISFESSNYDRFNKNRGVKNLHEYVKNGVTSLKNEEVTTFAISLINKSISNFDELVNILIDLGFDKVKFDYPISFKLNSTYKGWSQSPLLKYTGNEMETAIKSILHIKSDTKIQVINPTAGLLGAIDFYQNRRSRFPCYAGEKVLYLDWNLDFYRCPALGEKLGKVGDDIDFNRIDCNKCYYQGVRDFDPFYYLLENIQLNPRILLSSLNRDDMNKLYEAFRSAWEIRESGLV